MENVTTSRGGNLDEFAAKSNGPVMARGIVFTRPRNLVRGADVDLTSVYAGGNVAPVSTGLTSEEKDKLKKLALMVVVFGVGIWAYSKWM